MWNLQKSKAFVKAVINPVYSMWNNVSLVSIFEILQEEFSVQKLNELTYFVTLI